MKSTPALLLASSLLLLACNVEPPAKQAEAAKPAEGDEAAKAEAAKAGQGEQDPAKKYELTAEEVELLEADIKTLTPAQKRKRAYALRKKVMQDPDSDAAKTLQDMQRAVLAGEIEPQVPGAKPKQDEGLIIPAPPHLRSDEQAVSHDESAEDKPEQPEQPSKPAGAD